MPALIRSSQNVWFARTFVNLAGLGRNEICPSELSEWICIYTSIWVVSFWGPCHCLCSLSIIEIEYAISSSGHNLGCLISGDIIYEVIRLGSFFVSFKKYFFIYFPPQMRLFLNSFASRGQRGVCVFCELMNQQLLARRTPGQDVQACAVQ